MWTLQHLQQIALLALETSVVATILLLLFRARSLFGLSPLYIVLGGFQYLQAILASLLYFEIMPGIMVSPGSVVLFAANLFAVLLVYIREDATEARKLIYGLLAANLVLALLTLLFGRHLSDSASRDFLNLSAALSGQDLQAMTLGSMVLLADGLLIIILFEALSRFSANFLFLRIYFALAGVLAFDSLVFVTVCFAQRPEYGAMLVSGLVGKSLTSMFFALFLTGYFTFFGRREYASAHAETEIKDIFQVLTYRQKFEALRKRLVRDPLTGIFNRRFFEEFLPEELARSHKLGLPTSLLMIDVDHFKQINDRYGHQQGDRVLQWIAQVLTECSRSSDAACRYGGEEFAIVMPDANNAAARGLAERIRRRLRDRFSNSWMLGELEITATIGIATFPHGAAEAPDLIELADQRLYEGKKAGRDCVVDAEGVATRGSSWGPVAVVG